MSLWIPHGETELAVRAADDKLWECDLCPCKCYGYASAYTITKVTPTTASGVASVLASCYSQTPALHPCSTNRCVNSPQNTYCWWLDTTNLFLLYGAGSSFIVEWWPPPTICGANITATRNSFDSFPQPAPLGVYRSGGGFGTHEFTVS